MDKRLLHIFEKKIINNDRIVILSKKFNDINWYSLVILFIIISVVEFFRISLNKNKNQLIIDLIIVVILILATFFIFLYKKTKIKIVKTKRGDIIIERLDSMIIKDSIIKSKNIYFYSKHLNQNFYGLKLVFKDKTEKTIYFNLLPYYKDEKYNALFISKKTTEDLGDFLQMKVVFEE